MQPPAGGLRLGRLCPSPRRPPLGLGCAALGLGCSGRRRLAAGAPRMLSAGAPRMFSALPRQPILKALARNAALPAIVDADGQTFTHGQLLRHVEKARDRLCAAVPGHLPDLAGQRVALLADHSYEFVVALLAILAARAVAVPLCPSFPAPELRYMLGHSEPSLLVSSPRHAAQAADLVAAGLARPPALLTLEKPVVDNYWGTETVPLESLGPDSSGLLLYTSGTTDRPKGVLIPQSAFTAQARTLIDAWDMQSADFVLHVLPLHHIHGLVNSLLMPLFAGAAVEFLFPFDPDAVWRRLAAAVVGLDGPPDPAAPPRPRAVTFFTAVPTIYSRLLASHASLPPDLQEAAREAVSPDCMRLAVSGSAPLSTPLACDWYTLSYESVLLQRYGMTEAGMALSCGLDLINRVEDSVGWPLPGVDVRLVDVDSGCVIAPGCEVDSRGRERAGEIQLRGRSLFSQYWRDPEATDRAFVSDPDGGAPWFKTGDVAVRRPVGATDAFLQDWTDGPMYFIQGRLSVDIINTGGEKVSALEVESQLVRLDKVADAAVVAVPSAKWGHKVAAAIVLDADAGPEWTALMIRRAVGPRLAKYKIPQVIRFVDNIPRNAMGKLNRKQLAESIFADDCSADDCSADKVAES